MISKASFRLIVSLVLSLNFANVVVSQTVPAQVDPSNLTGIMPYNSYGGTREKINLRIPLVSLPGRGGFEFPLELVYDSKIWDLYYESDPQGSSAWWDTDYNSYGDR